MQTSLKFLVLTALTASLGACSPSNLDNNPNDTNPDGTNNKATAEAPSYKAPVGNIKFSYDVPQAQRDGLATAVSSLDNTNVKAPPAGILDLMKISDMQATTLHQWLEARVQYIIPNTYDLDTSVTVVGAYKYQNPNDIPVIAQPTRSVSDGQVEILMMNIGGAVYVAGKKIQTLLGMKLNGLGTVSMTSPRVGVLEIGNGIFDDLVQDDPATQNIYVLGVLFHEARHSDGNKTSAGFLHAVCPQGHDYEGIAACDMAKNGAYHVGAMMMKALTASCTDCTIAGKQQLALVYLDNENRLIGNQTWDDAPEGSR